MSFSGRTCALLIASALAVMGLGACRSSSGGASSSTTNASTAAGSTTATGSTLSFGMIGTFQATGTDYEDARAAVEAMVDQINASGGVNGHPIKVTVCDDQHDPNQATTCARNAVSAHQLAVLEPSSASGFGQQTMPILAAAKIPVIGNPAVSPEDWTNPDAYPLDPGAPAQYAGVAVALKNAGCTDVGSIQLPVPAGAESAKFLASAVESLGGKIAKNVKVGMSEPSYASPVAQLVSAGAKCIVPIILPTEQPKFLSAVHQSGTKLLVGGVTAAFNQQLLTSLGSSANGILLAGANYLPTDTSTPAVKEMVAAMAKYSPGTKATDTYATAAWGAATLLFRGVLPLIKGTVSSAAIIDTLDQAKNLPTGMYAPYTYKSTPPDSKFPRVMNTGVLTWKVENSVPVVTSNGFLDVSKIVNS